MEALTPCICREKVEYTCGMMGRLSGQRTHCNLRNCDTSYHKKTTMVLSNWVLDSLSGWKSQCDEAMSKLRFSISLSAFGQLITNISNQMQCPGSALELGTTSWGNKKGLDQDLQQLLITQHSPDLCCCNNSESCVLAFSASYARFLCCPYLCT